MADLTTYEPPASVPAYMIRRGDLITFPSGAICPECGSNLCAISTIIKSYPFDDCLEVHTTKSKLACPTEGCGYTHPSQPSVRKGSA